MNRKISAVLFDADGVLQHTAHDWAHALDERGGPGFAAAVFDSERAAMRGEVPMREVLERVADERGASVDVDETLRLWETYEVDAEALTVVDDVRAAGLRTALVTNQQDLRVERMTSIYAPHMDLLAFSCQVGKAKPDALYFQHVVEDLGAAPEECLFIDDTLGNVRSAERMGMHVMLHNPADGASGLRRALVEAGVLS